MTSQRISIAACLLALTLPFAVARPGPVGASDHNEPASINAISTEVSADAADVYGNFAWNTERETIVLALTFPAPFYGFEYLPGHEEPALFDDRAPNAFDPGVLYTWHLDVDGGGAISRNVAKDDETITARFGYDARNARWGIRVEGLPGADTIEGPVGRLLEKDGVKVQAGLFDEPFFVDLNRFFEGQQIGHLAFRQDVDYFKGLNVNAIVIEIPMSEICVRVLGVCGSSLGEFGFDKLHVWNSTHRLPSDPHIRPIPGESCESDDECGAGGACVAAGGRHPPSDDYPEGFQPRRCVAPEGTADDCRGPVEQYMSPADFSHRSDGAIDSSSEAGR